MTEITPARDALVAHIPDLRAFAISLCGNRDHGDDLVQDTLLSAWAHLSSFRQGTNMGAWLFTILRNRFLNEHRRRRIRGNATARQCAEDIPTIPEQEGWAISSDLRHALGHLPVHQREALVLVGAAGMSLAEAAEVCKCEVGTIKSRVSRGRARLTELMADEMAPADVAGAQRPDALQNTPRDAIVLGSDDRGRNKNGRKGDVEPRGIRLGPSHEHRAL
jgi:RNA polymerase sigma-70 factor (ECF subfamily)